MNYSDQIQTAMKRVMQGSIEPSERWVRVKYNDRVIADSRMPLLLIQFGPSVMPTYFFTFDEIDVDVLGTPFEQNEKRIWPLNIDGKHIKGAAWAYVNPPKHLSALSERITFSWKLLDWYEEEEQVFVHARDPHKRVDVMLSSRQVQIVVGDKVVADTNRPHLLFETWLPTRYYIPRADVWMEYLQETSHSSQCPYKGTAKYWTVKAGNEEIKNGVWSYPTPIVEKSKIKDLFCFYNEKVDIYVDDELLPRPITPWT